MNYKKVGFFFSLYMKKNNNTIKKQRGNFWFPSFSFFLSWISEWKPKWLTDSRQRFNCQTRDLRFFDGACVRSHLNPAPSLRPPEVDQERGYSSRTMTPPGRSFQDWSFYVSLSTWTKQQSLHYSLKLSTVKRPRSNCCSDFLLQFQGWWAVPQLHLIPTGGGFSWDWF